MASPSVLIPLILTFSWMSVAPDGFLVLARSDKWGRRVYSAFSIAPTISSDTGAVAGAKRATTLPDAIDEELGEVPLDVARAVRLRRLRRQERVERMALRRRSRRSWRTSGR